MSAYGRPLAAKRRRCGFSIVELIVALTLSVAVLSTATALLHRMFAHQQLSIADTRFHVSTSRLANVFRQDVRASTTCQTTGDDQNMLQLTANDGSVIRFRRDAEHPYTVHREKNSSSNIRHVDEFRLPASSAVQFEVVDDDVVGSIVQMKIRFPDPTLPADSQARDTDRKDQEPLNRYALVVQAVPVGDLEHGSADHE